MKYLSRVNVQKSYREIVDLYGEPKKGKIHCLDQLMAEIVNALSAFDEVYLIYEYDEFHVSTGIALQAVYAPDFHFIGTIKADDWFTRDQLRALHELAFGYQF